MEKEDQNAADGASNKLIEKNKNKIIENKYTIQSRYTNGFLFFFFIYFPFYYCCIYILFIYLIFLLIPS